MYYIYIKYQTISFMLILIWVINMLHPLSEPMFNITDMELLKTMFYIENSIP